MRKLSLKELKDLRDASHFDLYRDRNRFLPQPKPIFTATETDFYRRVFAIDASSQYHNTKNDYRSKENAS